MGYKNNQFVGKLQGLQQDGQAAISGPKNWKEPPLLEIKTSIDETITQISDSILTKKGQNTKGKWFFWIGSPGNGKSAAVGKLCRELKARGCSLRTEEGEDIFSTGYTGLPYKIEVCENGEKFSSAWLAQDASAVKNPFSESVDPANDLITLLSSAWEKGVSLVICTNRGVIERAARKILEGELANQPWAKMVKIAVANDSPTGFEVSGKKKVFQLIQFDYATLDNMSILSGAGTFKGLIEKAVSGENWKECDGCAAAELCPYKQNCLWLSDPAGKSNFLKLLQRAEALSGQTIVFREALGLLSFILAGCPKDYTTTPCDWVAQRIEAKDYFALLSRRVYMALYSSYTPYGLEENEQIREEQVKTLAAFINQNSDELLAKSISCVTSMSSAPSLDVGVTRLLGHEGIFKKLDITVDPITREFDTKWGWPFEADQSLRPFLSRIEEICLSIWKLMDDSIEGQSDDAASKIKWLSRWATSFTFRMGSLVQDAHHFKPELDEYLEIAEIQGKKGQLSQDLLRKLAHLEQHMQSVLQTTSNGGVPLAEYARLEGPWVTSELTPKIKLKTQASGQAIPVAFGNSTQMMNLSAATFCWLAQKRDKHVAQCTFPEELLESLQIAQERVVSTSMYAYKDSGVEIKINTPDGKVGVLRRTEGDVFIP